MFVVNFTGIAIVLYDVLRRSVHGSAGTDDDEICNSAKRVKKAKELQESMGKPSVINNKHFL